MCAEKNSILLLDLAQRYGSTCACMRYQRIPVGADTGTCTGRSLPVLCMGALLAITNIIAGDLLRGFVLRNGHQSLRARGKGGPRNHDDGEEPCRAYV